MSNANTRALDNRFILNKNPVSVLIHHRQLNFNVQNSSFCSESNDITHCDEGTMDTTYSIDYYFEVFFIILFYIVLGLTQIWPQSELEQ
jgi:hypothetical protein